MKEILKEAVAARARWIEGVLEQMLIAGIDLQEIRIQDHPDCRTVICVNDQPRSEWRIAWPVTLRSTPTGDGRE